MAKFLKGAWRMENTKETAQALIEHAAGVARADLAPFPAKLSALKVAEDAARAGIDSAETEADIKNALQLFHLDIKTLSGVTLTIEGKGEEK
jgi:hypothetical protein